MVKYMVTEKRESFKTKDGKTTGEYEGRVELTAQEGDGSYRYDCVDLSLSNKEEYDTYELGQFRTVKTELCEPEGEAQRQAE